MDPYIGEIRMFAGRFAPQGWAFCDGSLLPINQANEILFSLIGTTYGGDGFSNFALPDLRGRIPVGQGAGPGLTPREMGEQNGSETVMVTTSQLPAHSHPIKINSSSGNQGSPANAYWAANVAQYTQPADENAQMNPSAVSASGGGLAHDNMMPFLCISFIIALEGLYPTQN